MAAKYKVFAGDEMVKDFKHEKEALAFVRSQSNIYQYGQMTLTIVKAGDTLVWNEHSETWEVEE